jgi:hypothetical protein
MASPEPDEQLQLPIVWVGLEDVPVLASNQMAIQHVGRDEFILTFGELTPPLLVGTEEQRLEQAKLISFVTVTPVARVSFNRQRLTDLIRVLEENLARHDRTFEE